MSREFFPAPDQVSGGLMDRTLRLRRRVAPNVCARKEVRSLRVRGNPEAPKSSKGAKTKKKPKRRVHRSQARKIVHIIYVCRICGQPKNIDQKKKTITGGQKTSEKRGRIRSSLLGAIRFCIKHRRAPWEAADIQPLPGQENEEPVIPVLLTLYKYVHTRNKIQSNIGK